MEHTGLLPECKEIFKRVDDKLDTLIDRSDKINGRYEKHIDESGAFRHMVTKNTERLSVVFWMLTTVFIPVIFLLVRAAVKGF